MNVQKPTADRKLDHVRINLERDVGSTIGSGFDRYRFEHTALPELDLEAVDITGAIFGRRVRGPLLISSMTGGAPGLGAINRRLAEAAEELGIAMGVGSQRAAIESGDVGSFAVRDIAPSVPLFANLGAAQLAVGYGVDECRQAVDMLEADALILHLNAVQEAVQPEGDTRWSGLLARIEAVARSLGVPIIAKEVGWGISGDVARMLVDAGVGAIDVAGAGGTSWSEVEKHRAETPRARAVAAAFADWGIPTAECLVQVRRSVPDAALIASGGLRHGVDVAKAIALGAQLAGMAGPLLRAAATSTAAVIEEIDAVHATLRIAMFAVGAPTLAQLRDSPALVRRA